MNTGASIWLRKAVLPAAILAGCGMAASAHAVTYNVGTLTTVPYVNVATVTGAFTDIYNFSVSSSSLTAGTTVSVDLDLGNLGYHISNLKLDLFTASSVWLDGDTVTGPTDNQVSVTDTLAAGNYYFRVNGIGDGTLTNQGIYTFSAAAAPVPEASNWGMMLAGLGLVGLSLSRRRYN